MDLVVKGFRYVITNHAKDRMKKRKVTNDELEEALTNVKMKRNQVRDNETTILITGRNDISLVIAKGNIIVTVYKYKKAYYDSKNKNKFNGKRRQLKQRHGNRLKR